MLLTEKQGHPNIFLKACLPVTGCVWSKIVAKTFASAGKTFMTEAREVFMPSVGRLCCLPQLHLDCNSDCVILPWTKARFSTVELVGMLYSLGGSQQNLLGSQRSFPASFVPHCKVDPQGGASDRKTFHSEHTSS